MLRDTTNTATATPPDPTDLANVQAITQNIETIYNTLVGTAANIQGLLDNGIATCADLKAYNTWAIACYGEQQNLIYQLQTYNVAGVPSQPTPPTLFALAGVDPSDLNIDDWISINCDPSTDSLQGALAAAMAPPNSSSVYLSSADIQTIKSPTFDASSAPNFATLSNTQAGLSGNGTLGVVGLDDIIIVGVIVFLAYEVVTAVAKYFTTKEIQVEATARNANSLAAYQTATAARLSCYTTCMGAANAVAGTCQTQCASLIPPPALDSGFDPNASNSGLGVLGTIGLVTIAAAGGVLLFEHYKRKHQQG